MKYAAVILWDNQNPLPDSAPVSDALLAGGIFLDEIVYLPENALLSLSSHISRLGAGADGLFIAAREESLGIVRKTVEEAAASPFSEDNVLETENCLYAVLPNDRRGADLVKSAVVPLVDRRRKQSCFRMVLSAICPPEEKLLPAVSAAERAGGGKLSVHVRERYGAVRVEILYDKTTPKYAADEAVRILAEALGDFLYSVEDVSIASRLVDALKVRGKKISIAESFTGGGVGRAIVRIPGASAVYFEGLNTYNNASKEGRLGVSPVTLRTQGAVSDQTAYEMALGLLSTGNCDVAVATTGCAGPDADEMGTPVGLFFIAVGTEEQVGVYRYRLAGDRETVTETAINLALYLAYRALQ